MVGQLAHIGIDEVTLLGGEAFLRPDWLTIAAAVVSAGMKYSMTTGGWGITEAMAAGIAEAGIAVVGVSVDGLEPTHDALRGRTGSWQRCFQTMDRLASAGVRVGCNTQINRLSAPELPRLYECLRDAGIFAWQVQLTGPMGHAADRPEILLQPPELLDVFPLLARIARRCQRDGMSLQPGQNVGYYGPYERLLRSGGHPWGFWTGPVEGIAVIGIESDGSVKADPTLPSAEYVGGNVRDRPLRQIVEESDRLRFNLGAGTAEGTAHLWGFCQSCEHAELCRGGDAFTAHVFFGRRGNHPYCHHRALVLQDRGVRERLVLEVAASGLPYDHTGCSRWSRSRRTRRGRPTTVCGSRRTRWSGRRPGLLWTRTVMTTARKRPTTVGWPWLWSALLRRRRCSPGGPGATSSSSCAPCWSPRTP